MLRWDKKEEIENLIVESIVQDSGILDELRKEVRTLANSVQQVRPQSTSALSFVATDGGNSRLLFDPFLVSFVRIVDSSDNEYSMRVVTANSDIRKLAELELGMDNAKPSVLGKMMQALGVHSLTELSHMIRLDKEGRALSPSWVLTYRTLYEWATLLEIVRSRDYASDTLMVMDGLLRTKVFSGDLFVKLMELVHEAMQDKQRRTRRRLYLVGVAKHSKVLARYRLSMALENVMVTDYPSYVEVPRELERKAYRWDEFARGIDSDGDARGEAVKFVRGSMYFVKFGSRPYDPIWPIDIFDVQKHEASRILGYLLSDAIDGFPVPSYPRSLQKAHEYAALVDFDMDVLQDCVFNAVRTVVPERTVLDAYRVLIRDPTAERYE